jgi:hypothetical protein
LLPLPNSGDQLGYDREPNNDEEDHSDYAEDDFLVYPGPTNVMHPAMLQYPDRGVLEALREIDVTGPDERQYRVTPVPAAR